MGTGSLAAVWYLNSGSTISLSGTLWGAGNNLDTAEGIGKVIVSDSNNLFTVRISSSVPIVDEKINLASRILTKTLLERHSIQTHN